MAKPWGRGATGVGFAGERDHQGRQECVRGEAVSVTHEVAFGGEIPPLASLGRNDKV